MKGQFFKRVVAAVLALTLVGASIPANTDFTGFVGSTSITASAETLSGECGTNATWSYDTETGALTISGTGDMSDFGVATTPWNLYQNQIKSVTFADGITSVGAYALFGGESLETVSIPDSVTKIGDCAFWGCLNKLKTVTLPDNITTIGKSAFASCSKLETINIPSKLTAIPEKFVSDCENITQINIPDGVTSIGDEAFQSCKMEFLKIPASVTSIGKDSFHYCRNLESVVYDGDYDSLTWEEDGNDFITSTAKATGFHVRKSQVDSFKEKFASANVTFYGDRLKVTVAKPTNGTVEASIEFCGMDDTVNLNVAADDDYHIKSVKYGDTEVSKNEDGIYSFAMPENDVTVTAEFEKDSYTVTAATGITGGSVTASAKTSAWGDTVTVTPTAQTGYKVKSVKYNDGTDHALTAVDGKYSFTMPKKNVTVSAEFEKQKYTITWQDESGKTLKTDTVEYGTKPAYTGTAPTKAATAQYTYTFKGWTPEIAAATKDASYKATFNQTVNKYSLTLPKNMSVVGTASAKYDYGTTVKFKADSGYVVIGNVKNGTANLVASGGEYSVKITANTTITAVTGKKTAAVAATCEKDGNIEYYTGSDGKFYKDTNGTAVEKSATVVKATGHKWGAPSWKWDGTKSATATFTCANDKTHTKTEKAAITSKTTAATCDKDGQTVYTAKVTFNGKEYTDTKTETIKATGHSWSEWTVTKKPTTTAEGEETRTCSVCSKKETRAVSKKQAVTSERIAGKNRFATAAEISKASFKTADTVILAFGMNSADALAGVPLAKAYNAPILLTNYNTLPSESLAEIKRLGAKNVIILGGEGAISKNVANTLTKQGLKVDRELAGKTRFETATKIAQRLQKLNKKAPEEVFFVYAFNFADALSVSAVAATKNAPIIYLKKTGTLDDATKNYLASIKGSVKNAYVIGGTGVIDDKMMKSAADTLGLKVGSTVTRVAGKNRYETCVEINKTFASVLTGTGVCVAKGLDFPDALAGGVFAAINKAPLFLADGTLKDVQTKYLNDKSAGKVYVFGGTGAVPDKLVSKVVKASN